MIAKQKKCVICEKYFSIPKNISREIFKKRKYCSKKCQILGITGNRHYLYGKFHSPQTKDKIRKSLLGRKIGNRYEKIKKLIRKENGYILIYSPEHPYKKKNNYVFEHRLIMEKAIGRYLKRGEIIHHRNAIRDDNRIENLELILVGQVHRGEINCPFCKMKFSIK